MKNKEIRLAITEADLKYWQVAQEAGVCADTLSRWLRAEMPEERRERVKAAIERLRGGSGNAGKN